MEANTAMARGSQWSNILGDLSERSGAVRRDLASWVLKAEPKGPFCDLARPGGIFERDAVIDWRKLYSVNGSSCIYKLPTPFLGLLFYDTIFVGIGPCPKAQFSDYHGFRLSSTPAMIERAREGKVVFYLTDKPSSYARYEYLRPLFEEFSPLHLSGASARLVRKDNFPTGFDTLSEAATDLPHVKAEIARMALRNHQALEVVDATTCYTIQELYYYGQKNLATFLLDLLNRHPGAALPLIWSIRKLIIDTNAMSPGVSFAYSCSEHRQLMDALGPILASARISNVPDIGSVIANLVSFPSPKTWDELAWCEENLAVAALRQVFATLDEDIKSGQVLDTGSVEHAASEAWNRRNASVSRLKAGILWGASLTLAAAGTAISGPIAGILSALGLTAAQNLWLDDVAASASKMLKPQSYHIWNVQRTSARKQRPRS